MPAPLRAKPAMVDTRLADMIAERRLAHAGLKWLDANLWLGRPQGFPLAREMDLPTLLSAMQEYRISGGLVSHWLGHTASPQAGNEALLTLAPRLTVASVAAIWTGVPIVESEQGPLPGVGDWPESVRGVRVFPKTHSFALTDWCIGPLCRQLIDQNVPLFIWHTELTWPAAYDLARELPALNMIIESQSQKIIYHARTLVALMRDCPNVYLEISNATGPLFELICSIVGPERLIFGTFMPVSDPWVPIGVVLDSSLAEADRALIAGGNLRRLIGGGPA
jgi:uncharacterized protein